MFNEFFSKPVTLLKHFKNEDGGWGEHQTQTSRITNTCEVIWCLTNILENNFDSEDSINFILSAIKSENLSDRQNCQTIRDYAWVVIALTSYIQNVEIRDDVLSGLDASFDKITKSTTPWPEGDSKCFVSSLVLIALCFYGDVLTIRKKKQTKKYLTVLNEKINTVKAFANPDGGFPKHQGYKSEPGYTGYATYAIGLALDKEVKKSTSLDTFCSGLKYLQKANLQSIEFESGISDEKRPYRHFTTAWYLFALSISDEKFKKHEAIRLIKLLISTKKSDGWTIFNNVDEKEEPLTWATALATLSIFKFCSNASFEQFIDYSTNYRDKHSIFKKTLNFLKSKPKFFWLGMLVPLIILLLVIFIDMYFLDGLYMNFPNSLGLIALQYTILGVILGYDKIYKK